MNRYKYEIIIYWSPQDEAFVAEVPELAGCMAKNAQTVIEEWIETAKALGRNIPAPKGRLKYA